MPERTRSFQTELTGLGRVLVVTAIVLTSADAFAGGGGGGGGVTAVTVPSPSLLLLGAHVVLAGGALAVRLWRHRARA